MEYENSQGACIPKRVHTVVVSTQHADGIKLDQIRSDLKQKLIPLAIPAKFLDENTVYHLNPSGKFVTGGPMVSFQKIKSLIKVYSFTIRWYLNSFE